MTLNALTVDLEDWYQGLTSTSQRIDQWQEYESRVVASTVRLLDMLSNAGVKATFFVLGYVAERYPELIKRVANEGHEIALHGYFHQRVNTLTPDQFQTDIQRGLDVVEMASGEKVRGYRAPMFSINGASEWVFESLWEMGFLYDSSVFPIRNGYYGIPDAPRFPYRPLENKTFFEFPVATVKVFGINWPIGGGFYVRTLPSTIIETGIRRLNRQGKSAIMYLHPWELDTEQHFDQVTLRERITHYHGRSSLYAKLHRLLEKFKFVPIIDLLDRMI
jgi:polysaccharide deacetylase family protein (PEP-CTERM system associated)